MHVVRLSSHQGSLCEYTDLISLDDLPDNLVSVFVYHNPTTSNSTDRMTSHEHLLRSRTANASAVSNAEIIGIVRNDSVILIA